MTNLLQTGVSKIRAVKQRSRLWKYSAKTVNQFSVAKKENIW